MMCWMIRWALFWASGTLFRVSVRLNAHPLRLGRRGRALGRREECVDCALSGEFIGWVLVNGSRHVHG